MAVPRAASRRGAEGAGLHRRADRLHLQRDVRRRAARGRALHRRAGQRLLLVPLAHPRRPHQSLRPRHAPHGRLRLQAADRPTVSASTGRSATTTSRRTTTRPRRFIGVTGTTEGIRSAPDGIFNPPAPLRAHDALVQRACAKLGIRAVAARQAVTTVARNGRPPCHYCGQCGRGCKTASNYASSYVQIFPGDADRQACRSSPTRWRAS